VEQEVDNNLESNLATIILARAMVTSNIVNMSSKLNTRTTVVH